MIPDWPAWRARFEAFEAKKTREAARAPLFPFVTVSEHRELRLQPVGNAWSRQLFDGPFYVGDDAGHPERPACSLVFVQSSDGNTGADDPSSLGGGSTDKHAIYEGLSRVAADAILAGAGTVRGSDVVFSVWHPEMIALRTSLGLPRHPAQLVITNGGLDLAGGLMFNVPSLRVVLLTGPSVPSAIDDALRDRPWIVRVPVTDGRLDGIFQRLRAMRIARISCVGGRTLGAELLSGGLVDDVYLTTAATPGGDPDTPLAPWPWRGHVVVRKHGTGPESGVVFEQIVPRRA